MNTGDIVESTRKSDEKAYGTKFFRVLYLQPALQGELYINPVFLRQTGKIFIMTAKRDQSESKWIVQAWKVQDALQDLPPDDKETIEI